MLMEHSFLRNDDRREVECVWNDYKYIIVFLLFVPKFEVFNLYLQLKTIKLF